MIYKSFIMSNFDPCTIACPFCNQSSVNMMEKILDRFICDDVESPLHDLLQIIGAFRLHINRMILMAREVFKIVEYIVPSYFP